MLNCCCRIPVNHVRLSTEWTILHRTLIVIILFNFDNIINSCNLNKDKMRYMYLKPNLASGMYEVYWLTASVSHFSNKIHVSTDYDTNNGKWGIHQYMLMHETMQFQMIIHAFRRKKLD